jgi:hypothetical protein
LKAGNRKISAAVLTGALTLAVSGVALAAVTSGSYTGSTTQTGQPKGTAHFSVTKDHKMVQSFSGNIFATCAKSAPSTVIRITLNPVRDMTIHHSKFSFHGTFNIDNGRVVIAKHVDGDITGKFVPGRKATGTMKFVWTFDSNAPAMFRGDHCTTGTADYTVTHH